VRLSASYVKVREKELGSLTSEDMSFPSCPNQYAMNAGRTEKGVSFMEAK
jgi:hypothetical protein